MEIVTRQLSYKRTKNYLLLPFCYFLFAFYFIFRIREHYNFITQWNYIRENVAAQEFCIKNELSVIATSIFCAVKITSDLFQLGNVKNM